MSHKRNLVAAHLALLGANLFFGASFSVAKFVMPRLIEPFGFIFIRVVVVAALFWIPWSGGTAWRSKIEPKDWKLLILAGFFGVALKQLVFYWGLSLTTPIHGSLVTLSTPLIITLFSATLLGERLGWDKAIGLALGLGGAALLILGRQQSSTVNAPNILIGDLGILLNAISFGFYLLITRPLLQRYRPMVVARWAFLFGAVFVVPFGWQDFRAIDWIAFQPMDFGAVAFIVLCCTFFTYLWNTFALKQVSATTAGGYIYLQPLFAAMLSIYFAEERINTVKIVAAVLLFAGVYLVNFGWKRRGKMKIKQA